MKNAHATERLSVAVGSLKTPFAVVNGSGKALLEPGASRTVTVSFEPKKPRKFTATLEITSSDPDHAALQIAATGKGK